MPTGWQNDVCVTDFDTWDLASFGETLKLRMHGWLKDDFFESHQKCIPEELRFVPKTLETIGPKEQVEVYWTPSKPLISAAYAVSANCFIIPLISSEVKALA